MQNIKTILKAVAWVLIAWVVVVVLTV